MIKFKALRPAIAAVIIGTAFSSQAALITFGGVVATDGSGKTSAFVDPNDASSGGAFGVNGYFIETFDSATAMAGFLPGSMAFNNATSDTTGCAVNSTTSGVTIGGTGSLEVRSTSKSGVAAAPAGDNTCFAYTPAEGQGFGTVEIDYAGLLSNISQAVKIDYFGFYWGSVDRYNDFSFYNGNTLIDTLTGTSLLSQLSGSSGNQLSDKSNVYVNVKFAAGESFTRVVINSQGRAGEVDNIVIGLDAPVPVPEPTTIAAFGLALLTLVGLRRRSRTDS